MFKILIHKNLYLIYLIEYYIYCEDKWHSYNQILFVLYAVYGLSRSGLSVVNELQKNYIDHKIDLSDIEQVRKFKFAV